jgi:tellurite resistance protein TehA-like permease
MHAAANLRIVHDFGAWIADEASGLHPDCFALVMATGIISNTLLFQGHREWSDVLFAFNAVACAWLAALTAWRAIQLPQQVWADFVDPRLTFSFFTIVAGTCVLGGGLEMRGFATLAAALWLFALLAWFMLTYGSFAVLSFINTRGQSDVVHGAWLLAIVGTQALVVLGAAVASLDGPFASDLFVSIHVLWAIGLGLYGIFIASFCYRIFFFSIEPGDVTPVLWVVMGAAAITTNAGSMLVLSQSNIAFLQAMRPFIDDVAFLVWAWATWWIPLLLLLGLWKHVVRGVPLTYTPMLWSLVFPLGMYAMASLRLSLAEDFARLKSVSEVMIWIALAAWSLTSIAMMRSLWRRFRTFSAIATQPA